MISNNQKGRVGELIACAAIESLGWAGVVCPSEGYDLVAMLGGSIVRVQVKSTLGPRQDREKYKFISSSGKNVKVKLDASSVEILALVALDVRLVYFKPIIIDMPTSLWINPYMFSRENERHSWDLSINKATGKQNEAN